MTAPRHRKCPRHDLHDPAAECDPFCLNPARYYEGLAAKPEPHDCTECGTANGRCLTLIRANGRPCCGRCHYTDTHGALG